jgi:hypothetical protein
VIKAYVEIKHTFILTSAVDGVWSASRPDRVALGKKKKAPGYPIQAVWALELASTLWRRENLLLLTGTKGCNKQVMSKKTP